MSNNEWMTRAVALARENVAKGGRPFGAVIVRNGKLIAEGVNETHLSNDPTSHAELNAIRDASQKLDSAFLDDCTIYASGHPCPMCLGAMYLSRVKDAFFAYSNEDGAPFGLTTSSIYSEMARPLDQAQLPLVPLRLPNEQGLYQEWQDRQSKVAAREPG